MKFLKAITIFQTFFLIVAGIFSIVLFATSQMGCGGSPTDGTGSSSSPMVPCKLSEESCKYKYESECTAAGGTIVSDAECKGKCMTDGLCRDIREEECVGGQFTRRESCSEGGCCTNLAEDTCSLMTSASCDAVGGRYFGDGADCSACEASSLLCGNGSPFDPGEQCDDGNNENRDNCTNSCSVAACGDGFVHNQQGGTEQCDDGNTGSGDGCDSNCTFSACGNGIVTGSEACDDGNTEGGDGCSATCKIEICGDAVLDEGEDCDDGKSCADLFPCDQDSDCSDLADTRCIPRSGDQCSDTCQLEGYCGDGIRQSLRGEQCDDGQGNNLDACGNDCQLNYCGDNEINNGEICDDNNTQSGDGCDSNCTPTGCGNGVVTSGEACDDGNSTRGDGCYSCQVVENCFNSIDDDGDTFTNCDDNDCLTIPICSDSCLDVLEPNDSSSPLLLPVLGTSSPLTYENLTLCFDSGGESAKANDYYFVDVGAGALKVTVTAKEYSGSMPVRLLVGTSGENRSLTINTAPNQQTTLVFSPVFEGSSRYLVAIDFNNGTPFSTRFRYDLKFEVCDSPETCGFEFCGNGFTDVGIGEQCDDSNQITEGCPPGQTSCTVCNSSCLLEHIGQSGGICNNDGTCDAEDGETGPNCPNDCLCPNGRVDSGEECDDGTLLPSVNDGCSNTCEVYDGWECLNVVRYVLENGQIVEVLETVGCTFLCGNGTLDSGEACDDDNTVPGDGCSAACQLEICGNGVVDPGEGCDDGDTVSEDGCSVICIVESGYSCSGTPSTCSLTCGNSTLDAGESCDDGNTIGGDGCSPICNIEICGNSVLDTGEACEDGNTINGDGCSSTCSIEVCGNGILDLGEQCDDNNIRVGDGCSDTCFNEICGNGRSDPGETCDDSNTNAGDGCSAACALEFCGDGTLNIGEACDDGNTTAGDGCSATCATEVCGNSTLDVGEVCDDGNTTDGDGCSSLCQVEGGFPPVSSSAILHIDASDPANLSITDSAVNGVTDLSGSGNDLTPSITLNNAPTFEPNGIAGLGSIRFENSKALQVANDTGFNTQSFTSIIVFRPSSFDAWNFLIGDDSYAWGSGWGLELANDMIGPYVNFGGPTARVQANSASTYVASVVFDHASIKLYLNGTLVAEDASTAGFDFGPFKFGIGNSDNFQDSWGFSGLVGEVFHYPTNLPDTERQAVENALMTKWSANICGNGSPEGSETCDDGNLVDGDNCDNNCTVTACGNGVVTSGEECDDGNTTDSDGCSAGCTVQICGNGIIEIGETCDDYNQPGGGCSDSCTIEPGWTCSVTPPYCTAALCGDGFAVGGEPCDDGNTDDFDECGNDCNVNICGDGVTDTTRGETCDDYNQPGGGCSDSCTIEPGWTCSVTPPYCTAALCGDGFAVGGEPCDDGNTDDFDECGNDCNVNICGDGVTDTTRGETCDDYNQPGGGCSDNCTIEPGWTCSVTPPYCTAALCGDGFAVGGEPCDDGNTSSGDGCSSSCQVECGDGTCGSNENFSSCPGDCNTCGDGNGTCDAGETSVNCPADCGSAEYCYTSPDGCQIIEPGQDFSTCQQCTDFGGTCSSVPCPSCGDGNVDSGESCDDGNTVSEDGCSALCQVECGDGICGSIENASTCPADCASTCGNGVIDCPEKCDDGNSVSGDGCSSSCTLEFDWYCTGQPSVCTSCGGSSAACMSCNGECNSLTEFSTCPQDCFNLGTCGDGNCETANGENACNCPADCPA